LFQTEIAKRLNAICAQVIPFLQMEHQQEVAQAVERAKHVTTPELHTIVSSLHHECRKEGGREGGKGNIEVEEASQHHHSRV